MSNEKLKTENIETDIIYLAKYLNAIDCLSKYKFKKFKKRVAKSFLAKLVKGKIKIKNKYTNTNKLGQENE